jgi:hypothetical protein
MLVHHIRWDSSAVLQTTVGREMEEWTGNEECRHFMLVHHIRWDSSAVLQTTVGREMKSNKSKLPSDGK